MLGRPFTPPPEDRNFWKHARATGRMVVGVPVPPPAPGALPGLMRHAGYLRGYTISQRPRIHTDWAGEGFRDAIEGLHSYIHYQVSRGDVSAGALKEFKRASLYPFDLECQTLAHRRGTAEEIMGWVFNSKEATDRRARSGLDPFHPRG